MENRETDRSRELYNRLEEKLIDSIVSRSYVLEEAEDEFFDENGPDHSSIEIDDEYSLIPDEEDIRILLAREIHFSGSFRAMLSYYSDRDNKGIHPEIFLSRIEELFQIEERLGQNIAPLILKGTDAEKVARAKKMYLEMQQVLIQFYEQDKKLAPDEIPLYIVLLEAIFSEDSVEALAQRVQHLFQKDPSLLYPIIRSHDLYDHLSPGYGMAPLLAITLIGEIQDPQAIELLFQELYSYGREEIPEIDEGILLALKKIGAPVRQKMLNLIKLRPVGRENEKALQVLLEFLPDSSISSEALEQLIKGDISSKEILCYLALLMISLSLEDRNRAISWMEMHKKELPYEVVQELEYALKI
ncbi:MAG: hypothetical protein QRY74_05085 [Chlamydia sp.]